jgi:Polyphosphate kinase 2 (PPK2)/MgtC family
MREGRKSNVQNRKCREAARGTAEQKHLSLGKNCHYKKELRRLHIQLVKLQEWVRHEGLRMVVLFEGRDAAGKGGALKRITECLNPRICRVVALGTPTEREKTQWYFLRYVAHMAEGLFRLVPVEGSKILLVLFLSFLIGLEREERKADRDRYSFGGVRTFPLIGLIGYGMALLAGDQLIVVAVGFAVVGALLVVSYTTSCLPRIVRELRLRFLRWGPIC